MNKRRIIFLFLSCLFFVSAMYFYSSKNYISILDVRFNEENFPVVDVSIENHIYPLAFRLGVKFPLRLRKEVLHDLKKKTKDSTDSINFLGEASQLQTYTIPKVKVGNLTLRNVEVSEVDHHGSGELGKFLGDEFNLLVDLPNARIIACDSFSKLKKKQLIDGDWFSVPFEMTRVGPVMNALTDFGELKVCFSTTLDESLIQSESIERGTRVSTNKFCIGSREFRTSTFNTFDFPSRISNITDSFLGLDFIKKHTFYVDYKNKRIHFKKESHEILKTDIQYDNFNVPFLEVCIDEKNYLLEIDLGRLGPFSVHTSILNNIEKERVGYSLMTNAFGSENKTSVFKLELIKIRNLLFRDVIVFEDKAELHTMTDGSKKEEHIWGSVGYSILEHYDMFFDFPNSSVYFCKDLPSLKERGVFSDNILEVPFELRNEGLIVDIETEHGLIKFLVDTGCTTVAIMGHSYSEFNTFKFQGYDFGPQKIFSFKENYIKNFEGFLGMDFLMKYPFYIDYPNKKIIFDLKYK